MFNFLKNPFSDREVKPVRKSVQKELEAQKRPEEKLKPSKPSGSSEVSTVRSEKKSVSGAKKNLEAGFGIILKPHVSEKTAKAGTHDTYAFVVSRGANKIEIKKAFWKMYGVKPVSIQIANVSARSTYFRRTPGFKSAWKKAYVRVPKGSNIEVYEGV